MKTGKITRIGGVFFKSKDPRRLCEWYEKSLGLEIESDFDGGVFRGKSKTADSYTIWSVFPQDSDYFGSDDQRYMINFTVDDLEAYIKKLREKGVEVLGGPKETEFGKFGWVEDPERNRIELWEPRKSA